MLSPLRTDQYDGLDSFFDVTHYGMCGSIERHRRQQATPGFAAIRLGRIMAEQPCQGSV